MLKRGPIKLIQLLRKQTQTAFYSNFSQESLVISKEVGNNAMAILNRPKSLNALTLPMQNEMDKLIRKWEKGKSLVLIRGAGNKAFSTGGNVLIFRDEVKKNTDYLRDIVITLNATNYLVSKYQIPIVGLMNGLTLGGSVSYIMFAKYRVATENSIFGMPEIKLGFHPNSGATYFFNRCAGKLGYYLGLTGKILQSSDIVRAGFATHYCKNNNLEKLQNTLLNCTNKDNIEDIFENICEKRFPEFTLNPVMDRITNCFSATTIEDVLLKLQYDGTPWAKETLNILNRHSPVALKVTLRQFLKGQGLDLKSCLEMEGNISINFYKHPDVFEGIRVTLEDKHDNPSWNPPKLSDVTEEMVDRYFIPVVEDLQKTLLKEVDERT
ncbi:3-hydroxyisobutyryl-CoA hydrolase, mitochondrial-like [Diabrotica virgifera virgifera]|uniref:3-hydroxyisobutyryl-CoA hydrolase, mitochondrial n=1 Tax=Diabrotica virgifera virgifera TaxID=50390 RepID=A0ABM5I906_DIAVI|nr:3-hydroxyisobutyryl-CoA hydrolase, mitochondrial-like [Diabrotica virgifera virgifera]